jgi:mannitol-1-/sugar-/sorbitol-6-phosphatase
MEESMELLQVRAVLFDMDGTLVTSDEAVERAWTTWAHEYAVDPAAVLAIAHGSPAESTVDRMLHGIEEPARTQAANRQLQLQYDDLSDVSAAPGAVEVLATIERLGMPWAVVTSADRQLARARLGAAGIDAPVLVTIEDIEKGKPDPEGYLRAAELLETPPSACLVVEDAEVGLEAGRAAGAITAALKGLSGDVNLADLHQLAKLLDRS